MQTIKKRHIRLRRDTAANWTEKNPVLRLGEFGYETDSATEHNDIMYVRAKLGDGETPWADLTYIQIGVPGGGGSIAWADITGKPEAFTPDVHSHPINQVTGLQSALDSKAASSHDHVIGDVTGLQAALDGKAGSSHTHSIGQVTGLQSALGSKADLVGGVIPTSQIPAQAISEFLGEANSEAAMLALVGQRGDWCIRTDLSRTYFLISDAPSNLASWRYIETPGATVVSVNGQVGVIVLGAADVGADPAGSAATAEGNANAYTDEAMSSLAFVEGVTGDSVDNIDPANPVVKAWPLAGTSSGNPVTGPIEIDPDFSGGDLLYQDDGAGNKLGFNFGAGALQLYATDGQDMGMVGVGQKAAYMLVTNVNDEGNISVQVNTGSDASIYPIAFYIGAPAMRIQPQGVAAPTVNDDGTRGYGVNSTWVYDGRLWICKDKNTGAAVWREVGPDQLQADWNQANNALPDFIKNKPNVPVITSGTAAPSGGNDGDIYLQYT